MKRSALLVAMTLAGCGGSGSEPDRRLRDLTFQIEQMSARIDRANQAIDDNALPEAVELSPGEKGFAHLTDGAINLTASLEGLKQRGSATDATIRLGNLTTATLSGCEALVSVRYAKDGAFEALDFRKFEGDIQPGKWNNITVSLADVKADSVSAVRIRVPLCRSISLAKP